jgi:hypothetical protein
LEGREVDQGVGQACKQLLRLAKDDYLWFVMTKRLVKRERAERLRKQAVARREAQLKRRLSSGSSSRSGHCSKHVRRTDDAQQEEGERMEMEDKPEEDRSAQAAQHRSDGAADVGSGEFPPAEGRQEEGDQGGCGDDSGDDEEEEEEEKGKEEEVVPSSSSSSSSLLAGDVPLTVVRRKEGLTGLARMQRKMKMKMKMLSYDLRKPATRDWKWVYRCKTVPAPPSLF